MGDLADLLVAIGGLVTALAGAFALVWTTVVKPRRDPPQQVAKRAATQAAREAADQVLAALADGEITLDEIDSIRAAVEAEGDE